MNNHRIVRVNGNDPCRPDPAFDFLPGKTFQNRKVSSPAPVTIVCPSGDIARYNTRYVCPVKVATFAMEGYFQRMIWFNEYP